MEVEEKCLEVKEVPELISLNQLEDNLDFFHKMYDSVRLVDPLNKKVMDYRSSLILDTKELCYNYWGTGKICDNCISIRAYQENKSFIKLEKNGGSILMVTALPILNTNQPVVLELLKDATDSMFMGTGDYNTGEVMLHVIQEMSDMVIRDPLTSLYNRRFIDDRLPVDVINAAVNKAALTVCFIDLDNFKLLNDTYGHEVGDQIIVVISQILKDTIRSESDWAARYGGDEFLLCLNHADSKQAERIMKRIAEVALKADFSAQGESVALSLSYGIASMQEKPRTAEELIRLADRRMFEAKKNKKKINTKGI